MNPLPHQAEALRALDKHNRCVFAFDMGLG